MLDVYDGNNYARVVFETDTAGLGIRRLFMDVFHNPNPCIVVFDGKGAKESRRKIYPEYKAKRPPAPDGFYRILNYWKELLAHTHAITLEVPGFEADDAIAMLARSATGPTRVKSTDRDYCALINELVSVPGATMGEVAIEDIRLFKTLVGDNSDNVPGILKFGKKGFAELTLDKKREIIAFLNKEIEWTDCLKTDRLNNWVRENTPLLRSFWQVVDFLPIPPDQFSAGMKFGTKDLLLAESKLSDVFQGSNSTGRNWDEMLTQIGMAPKRSF